MRGLKLLIATVLVSTPTAARAENGKWDCSGNSIVVLNGKVLRVHGPRKEVIIDVIDLGDQVVWMEHDDGTYDFTLDIKAATLTVSDHHFPKPQTFECQHLK